MNNSRRRFISGLAVGSLLTARQSHKVYAANGHRWHEDIAVKARQLSVGEPLRLLIPKGSGANILAATREFTRLTNVPCTISEVGADDINLELILGNRGGDNTIDVALPATFGLIDLAQANAIISLDEYASRYEPPRFSQDHLYRKGDSYAGKLYGYQADGDTYVLFYNKAMMQDPQERKAYKDLTGYSLEPATSWEHLDSMMKFFQRPQKGQYGGSLYRNPDYLVWEWWARFHAKGGLPFDEQMNASINSPAGIESLDELIAATDWLSPGAKVNGLVDNWKEFSQGNSFCNIGWGGTQKYLMHNGVMRDNLIHGALPGPLTGGAPTSNGYFNWGWNYTVGAHSTQPELAYLLALFCSSPAVSTLAVRESGGFFDPFLKEHYKDEVIRSVYGDSFLKVHQKNMENAIPDLYLRGQSNYLDALRLQILVAITGELSASEVLDACARQWAHLTRRLGKRAQLQQWQRLLASYPANLRQASNND